MSNFKCQISNKKTKFLEIGNWKLEIPALQAGQSLVEILVAIGLSSIILPALFLGLYTSYNGKAQANQRAQAVTILRETNEAVRSVRENGWSNIATNGTYHPQILSGTWSLVSGSGTVNGFTRSVVIND